jgi:hypothetical protein
MAASFSGRIERIFVIGNCEFRSLSRRMVTERRERAGAGSDVLALAFLDEGKEAPFAIPSGPGQRNHGIRGLAQHWKPAKKQE